MGILGRIFGETIIDSNSLENKIAIYLALFSNLAQADGEAAESEVQYSRKYLADIPGVKDITENEWERIFIKSENLGLKVHEEAAKLNDEHKFELINYLIGAADADGHFDSTEISFIMVISIILGLDPSVILTHLNDNYNIDQIEIDKSTQDMARKMKAFGIKI